MITTNQRITAAWAFLVGATILGFWLTSHLGSQIVVIAACMALTSVKVIIVFRRFMEADHLTPPLKIFTYAWTIGCAAMIVGVAWLTTS